MLSCEMCWWLNTFSCHSPLSHKPVRLLKIPFSDFIPLAVHCSVVFCIIKKHLFKVNFHSCGGSMCAHLCLCVWRHHLPPFWDRVLDWPGTCLLSPPPCALGLHTQVGTPALCVFNHRFWRWMKSRFLCFPCDCVSKYSTEGPPP